MIKRGAQRHGDRDSGGNYRQTNKGRETDSHVERQTGDERE